MAAVHRPEGAEDLLFTLEDAHLPKKEVGGRERPRDILLIPGNEEIQVLLLST